MGLAKIMRSAETPRSKTFDISPRDAQSKPAPHAARTLITGSLSLHLTAGIVYKKYC